MTLLSDAEIEQRLAAAGEWRRHEHDSIVRELNVRRLRRRDRVREPRGRARRAGQPPPRHPRARLEPGAPDVLDPLRGRPHRRRLRARRSHRPTGVNGLKLILTAVLIAVNAFFVIAEYALVRSRRSRLEVMREEGARGAALALEQLGSINEYISAVQIGVTMTSIGIGALGEPALARSSRARSANTLGHGVAVAIAAVVAFLIIASAQLIAGEMVPKFYAIDRAEAVARRVARPLQCVQRPVPPVHRRAHRGRRPHPAAARRRHEPRAARRLAGRAQAADRRVLRRRAHRPGRGGHADRGLPPARAGGTPGDDPDPRGRHGRPVTGRGDGAAACASPPATHVSWSPRTPTPTACAAWCTPARWPTG